MAYGSEASERTARIDLALFGQAAVAIFLFWAYGVPLLITSGALLGYLMFIMQPSTRDYMVATMVFVINGFFREIGTRGRHNIPEGPIMFVIAPHANQMLDPLVVMTTCGRSDDLGFLVAAKTYRSSQFGWMAKVMGSIPVERPQDLAEKRDGQITSKGNRVYGQNTKFTSMKPNSSLMAKGDIVAVTEIVSDTELVVKAPFGSGDIAEPTNWKEVPHVEQANVYGAVYDHLNRGNAFGIFPEGGSHDRPDLLPLKAGAAIMALGAMQAYPDLKVKIVPVGLNYFAGDRFRSRVYVDYGRPIEITEEMVQGFSAGGEGKRAAVGHLMDLIKEELAGLTLTADSSDLLKNVWCARRLWTPTNQKMTPKDRLRLSHRFLEGFKLAKDQPVIQEAIHRCQEYNEKLEELGLHDHQIGRVPESTTRSSQLLIERIWLMFVYSIVALPGVLMWAPIYVLSLKVSGKKKKEALAGSIVKLEGKDVVGTWKVMTAVGAAPILFTFYALIVLIYFQSLNAVAVFMYIMGPSLYLSVRAYEQMPRLYRSIKALTSVVANNSDGRELRAMRTDLKHFIRRIVDEDLTQTREIVAPDFNLNEQKELRKRFSLTENALTAKALSSSESKETKAE